MSNSLVDNGQALVRLAPVEESLCPLGLQAMTLRDSKAEEAMLPLKLSG